MKTTLMILSLLTAPAFAQTMYKCPKAAEEQAAAQRTTAAAIWGRRW